MKLMALILLFFVKVNLHACSHFYKAFPPELESGPLVSQSRFYKIIDEFKLFFSSKPIAQNIEIIANWDSEILNAFSKQTDNKKLIFINGGFARIKGMTEDAFRLILCHEFGHHISGGDKGVPSLRNGRSHNRSIPLYNEGEADYWAAKVCMKNILSTRDSDRVIKAGLQYIEIVKKVSNSNDSFSITEKDSSLAKRKLFKGEYPSLQCRLDSYIAGALNQEKPLCWNYIP